MEEDKAEAGLFFIPCIPFIQAKSTSYWSPPQAMIL